MTPLKIILRNAAVFALCAVCLFGAMAVVEWVFG